MLCQISFGSLVKAQNSLLTDRQRQSTSDDNSDVHRPRSDAQRCIRKHQDELKRSTKNAPQMMSSKYAVTRRREVVTPKLGQTAFCQDPRFDRAVDHQFDEKLFRKNYSFLDDYRDSEMILLKAELLKSEDPSKKEKLAQKIKSMVKCSVSTHII